MAKKSVEKTVLKKGKLEFELVGTVKISDKTFQLDKKSKTSDWLTNVFNVGVNCGNGNTVYAECSSGYGGERENWVYNVKGKKLKEGSTDKYIDDYSNIFNIAWEDRFNDNVLSEIGNGSFLRVGIEKDKDGKLFTKKFLTEYDMVNYLFENKELFDGKTVRVKGDLEYSIYNNSIRTKKKIKTFYLSEVEEKDFKAEFVQTILLDRDSIGKLDKETGLIPIYAKVIDYAKNWNDKEIKQNVPFAKTFYIENEKLVKVFKTKKGITEIQVTGKIVEGQAKANIDINDLPDDIKELIDMGAYSEEEAIKSLAIKGERVNQWIITKPVIIMKGKDDEKVPVVLKTEEKYKEEELIFDFMIEEDKPEEPENNTDDDEEEEVMASDEDVDDFLNDL